MLRLLWDLNTKWPHLKVGKNNVSLISENFMIKLMKIFFVPIYVVTLSTVDSPVSNLYDSILIWFDWYFSINTIYFSGMFVLAVPVRLSLGLTLAHGRNSMEFFRIRWKKSLLTLLFLCFVDDRFSSRQPSISLLPFFHFWHVEIRIFKKCDRISLLQMQYK